MFAYPDGLFWCAFADPSTGQTDSVMAAALAADPEDDELLLSPEWSRADALLRTGQLDAAIAADEELLRVFGQSIVTQSTAFPAGLIRELVVHLYHQLLGRWVTGTRRPELHWQDVTAARHFGRLA